MNADELRSALRESRARLFDSLRTLAEEQFRFAPENGAWSIATHLAHLLRTERLYAERARAALEEDGAFCPSTRIANDDDPALAQRLAVPQIIHGLQAVQRDLEGVLDAGEAALIRAILHERLRRMTVEAIVRKMADHESEHATAVAALAREATAARRVTIPIAPRSLVR